MRKTIVRVVMSALLGLLIASCSKFPSKPVSTPQQPLPSPAPAAVPIPLHPALADAITCVANCKTVYRPKSDEQLDPKLDLPKKFAALLEDPSSRAEFEAAVSALPIELQESLTAKPGKEATGSLAYVVAAGDRRIYLYSLVRFNPPGTSTYYADVAVDAASKKVSILLQPTPDLDQYYLTGPDHLQAVLLLDAVAAEIWMGKEQLKLARDPSAKVDWSANPFVLPFGSDETDEILGRLKYLNTKYANGQIHDIAPVEDLAIAKRIKAAAAWYGADLNFANCISTMSPAERIAIIQESGVKARTRDSTDSTGRLLEVEVSYDEGGHERYYRYFKTREDCEASLPRNQAIPDRYR